MINKFKNAFLNAVSAPGSLDGGPANGPGPTGILGPPVVNGQGQGTTESPSQQQASNSIFRSKSPGTGGRFRRPSDSFPHSNTPNSTSVKRPVRYEYSRPHFLKLFTQDEILVTADHGVRPIIVPRELSTLPWGTGYAETINSGKSKRNEDQARVHSGSIRIPIGLPALDDEFDGQNSMEADEEQEEKFLDIPYQYFGIFDGHAGPGAAVAAAAQLHNIIHEKLTEIGHHLADNGPFCESSAGGTMRNKHRGILWFPQASVTNDSLIVGALESAFEIMDDMIERENKLYDGVNGGCTAVITLFILGKIYIANAGDSRAILCRRNFEALALSEDFTPETERTRVRQLAALNPHLLGNEFTALEFLRRPVRKDIGTKILYRGGNMTGWAYKIATEEDLRFPVVFGYGKRSRVLATIGVTRGFGDHELNAHGSSIRIKPFLKSQPEVRIIDARELECGEDDVILMGTDGLWDVTSNDTAANIVFSTLDQFPNSDPTKVRYRYISAAQDLVMHARGKFNDRNWRMADGSAATIDDISVFVIPIHPFKQATMEIQHKYEQEQSQPKSMQADGNYSKIKENQGISNGNGLANTTESVLNGDEIDLLVRTPKLKKTKVSDSKVEENSNGNSVDSAMDIEVSSPAPALPEKEIVMPVSTNQEETSENSNNQIPSPLEMDPKIPVPPPVADNDSK